jgi:hypothetical protein
VLAACGGEAPAPAADAPSDPGAAAPPPAPAARTFDPGAVQPGDTLFGLVVASVDGERAAADSVWVGNVVLEGDLVLQGVYQPHSDWPEVTAPCFHVTDPASAARIPRFEPDAYTVPDGKTWFCFSNPDAAIEMLGPAEEPREMVIALGRYQLWRQLSDVHDMGELTELLEVGPAAGRTLIDP